MKDWELERLYRWIWAAVTIQKGTGVKFFLDINDKTLFNLVLEEKKWKIALNHEISVRYSDNEIKILGDKIESLNNNDDCILELPKFPEKNLEQIENVKEQLKGKKVEDIQYKQFEHYIRVQGEPVDFGIEWIRGKGIETEDLSIIGF